MTRLRLAILGVFVLIVAGAVVAIVLATRERPPAATSLDRGQLLAASATLSPASQLFASALHVRIDAVVDRRELDPDRVVLDARWAPYEPIGSVERRRTDVGPITRLRWVGDLHCVVVVCVPDPGSAARKQLRPSYIRYVAKPGEPAHPAAIRIVWPEVTGFSRVDPIHLQRNAIVSKVGLINRLSVVLPPWQLNSLPVGSDSYRISPTTLFWLALLFAAVLVASAVFLARPWLPALGLRRTRPGLSPLERALATVDRAQGRGERRKALELLAEELRSSGHGGLAGAAKELAWAKPAPGGDRTAALTAEVRRDLERRTNGHRV
jgi:hypothetical protein